MRIRHKLWLEDDSGLLFGQGRFNLLQTIEELGSLSAAAKAMKMSYRAAWGRIRASEERLGLSLLQKAPVGRSLVLTPAGKKLLDLFGRFEDQIEAACQKKGQELFGRDLSQDLSSKLKPNEPD